MERMVSPAVYPECDFGDRVKGNFLFSDWRGQLVREDSPWFPSMRLFHQAERGNWAEVFERIARALEKQVRTAMGSEGVLLASTGRAAVPLTPPQRGKGVPMADQQTLATAVKLHQAGDLARAGQLYRQILQTDPGNVGALHLFGLVCHQLGKSDLAIDYISQALRLKPDYAEAHLNL